MKKKLLITLLVATMAVSMTACGDKENSSTEQASEQSASEKRSGEYELDLEKLVKKLPEYKSLLLDIDSKYEVTDDSVNEYLNSVLVQFGADAYVENKDRDVVEDGDYVKVDYTGYKDDVAFDGGSATDQLIDVTNNCAVGGSSYIEGFTAGIIGAKVGDTVKCPVTFPEQYQSEELAGQDVIFEFTIKAIYTTEPLKMTDLTDETVKNTFSDAGIETVSALDEQLKADLDNELYNAQVTAAKDYIIENSEVEIPEDYFNARYSEYIASLEKDYASDTQSLEDVVTAAGGNFADYETMWKDNLTTQIKVELVFGRIAQLEGIELDDAQFEKYINAIISQGSGTFADANAVYEYFGAGNASEGQAYLEQQYRVNKAVDLVTENVTSNFVNNDSSSTDDASTEGTEGTEDTEATEATE